MNAETELRENVDHGAAVDEISDRGAGKIVSAMRELGIVGEKENARRE
jgi:hypothetical protein